MKIKIKQNGCLEIYRKNKFKAAICPFDIEGIADCGDWCALFEDPCIVDCGRESDTVLLKLCNEKIYLIQKEDFEDLRGE